MYQFIETIKIEDGFPINLSNHQTRLNETRKFFYGNNLPPIILKEMNIPPNIKGIYKGRIVYDRKIVDISFTPYNIRTVKTLQLISNNEIEYPYKSIDRSCISKLFALRGKADDILIIKNNYLTDTSIGNIALLKGNQWYTPTTPLLKGTYRKLLLDKGILKEAMIHVDELQNYSHLRIFNAMITFGQQELSIEDVLPLK